MSESVSNTALVARRASGGLLEDFVQPLVMGQKVFIHEPLDRNALDRLVSCAVEPDTFLRSLQSSMYAMALRLVPHALDIRLTEQDLKLAAVAYQICWFFHGDAEEGNLWQSRAKKLVEECERVLSTVGLPRTEAELIGRHLLLRHLSRVFRTDTKLEFNAFFWRNLEFRGQEPQWARWPLRADPLVERTQVRVHEHVYAKPAGRLYYGVLSRSPLTNLLQCDRLYPQFTFWGSVVALALPAVCRLVTDRYMSRGLHEVMPALAHAFGRFLEDSREPLAHRRYMARFMLNLGLTWCYFSPRESLGVFPGGKPVEGQQAVAVGATPPASSPKQSEATARFYEFFDALYALRGPLGATHLASTEDLDKRVALFVSAANLNQERQSMIKQKIASCLDYVQ